MLNFWEVAGAGAEPAVTTVHAEHSFVQEVVRPIVAIATTNNNFFIRKSFCLNDIKI